jgi:hypothetical protein
VTPKFTPEQRRQRREAFETIKHLEATIKDLLNGQRRKDYIEDIANGVGDGSLEHQDTTIASYRRRIEDLRAALDNQKPTVTLDAVKAAAAMIYPSLEEK